MRNFFPHLTKTLSTICPAYLHLPEKAPYPHMVVEPLHSLSGLPGGPVIVTFTLKLLSNYSGTKEILKLGNDAQQSLTTYPKASLKILKSALSFIPEKKIRLHTFHVKGRIPYESH